MQSLLSNPSAAIGSILVVLTVFNLLMSFLGKVFVALQKSEPGWMVTLGNIGQTVTDFLSANVQHPSAPASDQSQPASPAPTQTK